MISPILLYIVAGCVCLAAALWIAGDFEPGKRLVITWRMVLLALAWPAAILWLVGAAVVDIVQHLRRR